MMFLELLNDLATVGGEQEQRDWTSAVRTEPIRDGEELFKVRIRYDLEAPEANHAEINELVDCLKDLLKACGLRV